MAELEYQNLDVLSCVILAVIFGSVGVVIFLLFFKSSVKSKAVQLDEKDSSDSDSEKKVQTPSLKPAQQTVGHKKKVVKDLGSIHPYFLASLKGHSGAVLDIDISSNGKLVASCSEDRTVRLWKVKDFHSKEHKYIRVNVEFDYPSCISFSPDSRAFIVALGTEKILRVYKIHKKKEGGGPSMSVTQEFDFPNEHKNEIINVAISPSGKFIISADKETQIIVWNTKGEVLDKIDTLLIYNTYACVSPCGNLVAACGFTPDVKLWYIGFSKSNEFTQVSRAFGLKGHFDAILSFSFSNDSKRIATISKDGTWKIWDIDIDYLKGQEAYLLHTGRYESVDGVPAHIAISHNYFTVAIALGSSIHFYNTFTQNLEESLNEVHQGNVTALQWYADSRQLISAGGTDRSVRLWHNPIGVKANLLDLIDKLPKAKTDTMKERIQNQIEEAKEYLAKFQR